MFTAKCLLLSLGRLCLRPWGLVFAASLIVFAIVVLLSKMVSLGFKYDSIGRKSA